MRSHTAHLDASLNEQAPKPKKSDMPPTPTLRRSAGLGELRHLTLAQQPSTIQRLNPADLQQVSAAWTMSSILPSTPATHEKEATPATASGSTGNVAEKKGTSGQTADAHTAGQQSKPTRTSSEPTSENTGANKKGDEHATWDRKPLVSYYQLINM
ncbi:hypothetical protein H4Q26_007971 [Puccinia striiformis f. sp. tritici PST-130]|nr:hypothetical protein H4Q26_007971 [Puccinia striiformis f. sp. tritici PST-130]